MDHADQAIWDPKGGITLTVRNDTVRAALAGGWTAEEIAQYVRVSSVEVERWAGLTVA